MITFCILLFALLVITVITAIIGLVCGAGFIAVFGDLLVCVLIVWLLVKLFRRRK